jgi:TFIIF-interacting CTD phosphatase-like protein
LNRNLKNVVMIDFDANKVQYHQGNVMVLPKYEGDPDDRELYKIIPFLECKHISMHHSFF